MPYVNGQFVTWDDFDKAIATANSQNAQAGKPSWQVIDTTKLTQPKLVSPVVNNGVVTPTPTTITPQMTQTNPLQNQLKYVTNMSNGFDQFGNPVTAGQQAWATDQLSKMYNPGSAIVPTAQPTTSVQGPTTTVPNGNSLLPSTGGVGGMMDKIAPVFVLLILVKIISGVGGLFKR